MIYMPTVFMARTEHRRLEPSQTLGSAVPINLLAYPLLIAVAIQDNTSRCCCCTVRPSLSSILPSYTPLQPSLACSAHNRVSDPVN